MSDINSDSTSSVESDTCFHCGLPLKGDTSIPQYKVQNKQRDFCCHGCHVVCKTIIESGLDDFYQFRTISSGQAETNLVPDILEKLKIYDRPELQKSFVYSNGEWQEASLMLEDIRCPACLWLNEHHLRQQKGVLEVSIDAATQRMRLRWDSNQTELSTLLRTIADIGYIAHPYDAKHTQNLIQTRKTRSIDRLIFAGFLGMMVMNYSIATYLLPEYSQGEKPLWMLIGGWTSLFVCTTLLAYPAQDFWLGAWRDLKNKRLGMDLPIVFGLSAAYFGSFYSLITNKGDVYFDSIAMFIFFVLLARYFEVAGKLKAASYIDQLGRATPQTAYKFEGKNLIEVPVFDLQQNDVIRILPGETAAADGDIVKGSSTFDESLLTGESEPVLKALGDSIIAGSVNGEQLIHAKISKIGQSTVIGTIKRLVDSGLEKKPDVVLLTDKAARIFVPVILLLAILTAAVWFWLDPSVWLSNTIAVLIVTCPCALALATPVALSITAGRFVKMGVLPINMAALENLALANVIALDKTGTLTNGNPYLIDVELIGDTTKNQVFKIANSLALTSEHPLAKAICVASTEYVSKVLDIQDLVNKPGFGLSGVINNEPYYLGNLTFILDNITLNDDEQNDIKRVQNKGLSMSILASNSGVLCLFCFSDKLREGAKELLNEFNNIQTIQSVILSGDTQQNANVIANTLGIQQVHGGLTPEQKLNWVRESQQQGNKVLMFGDGINDAPTLAAADVSVSITGATDLAHLSSDFVLLKSDITVLAEAKRLAVRSRRNIKQNMMWAVSYNIIAVPLAILGFVPPWLAAIGMSASSLIVVLNALRLKK